MHSIDPIVWKSRITKKIEDGLRVKSLQETTPNSNTPYTKHSSYCLEYFLCQYGKRLEKSQKIEKYGIGKLMGSVRHSWNSFRAERTYPTLCASLCASKIRHHNSPNYKTVSLDLLYCYYRTFLLTIFPLPPLRCLDAVWWKRSLGRLQNRKTTIISHESYVTYKIARKLPIRQRKREC